MSGTRVFFASGSSPPTSAMAGRSFFEPHFARVGKFYDRNKAGVLSSCSSIGPNAHTLIWIRLCRLRVF
jgi:hypothetical protein